MNLSPEMQKAVDAAKEAGGKLDRLPGGFWVRHGQTNILAGHFGTTTIRALMARGVATYTDHRVGLGGGFPVQITLIPPGDSPVQPTTPDTSCHPST